MLCLLRARFWAVAAFVSLLAPPGLAQPGAPADAPQPPPPRSDAYRPLGPELFPLYQHYLQTADSTEVRNVLYLYASTDNPNGNWSRLLAPLFYRSVVNDPRESRLYLFPLLFFHKASETESFNFALPLFYDYRTPDSTFQMLLPAWMRTRDPAVTRNHILFPLFRHSQDESAPQSPVTSTRAGLWRILELWESRSDPAVTDYRALNLFNWKDETRSGLPLLYSYSWSREGGAVDGRTYLFPFYWHGKGGTSEYRWIVPFYGYSHSPGESDVFVLPLLSRLGGDSENALRLDFLFPLFHYARSAKGVSVASFPLFDYSRSETETTWSAFWWPYRTTRHHETGKQTHSFFYPLSSFDVEPDGSRGTRWVFPYIETFNDRRLWRFVVPLYYEYQKLAGGSADWFFRTGLPLFWSWGYADDNFSFGFPLYWASENGPRGWHAFLPIYLDSYSASSLGVHVLPLVSYRSLPSRKQLFLLGPTYVHESFYGLEGEPAGSGNHVLWPFFGVERRNDGYLYRFLPFFSLSREGDTTGTLISPFYYQEDGPRGTHRYFVPFYGRSTSNHTTRDFYAAASYIRTREMGEPVGEGAPRVVRERDDILWSLLSFEKEHAVGGSHQHILPLGYWNTKTQAHDVTVAGPLYYSHRISDGDEDHHLNLVLGNVFFSKVVEQTSREETTPTPAAPAPLRRERIASDQGFLWPLTRWYKDKDAGEGRWVLPFYAERRDELSSNFALFPFYFRQEEETPYNPSYFRYFYLYNSEDWRGGSRRTVGQLLFDWKREESSESLRWRFLYPVLEHESSRDGFSFQLTPLFHVSRKEGVSKHWLFPFFWMGGSERKLTTGETRPENRHFFLFPFYGIHERFYGVQESSKRSDHYVLFPLLHFQTSTDAFRMELWPTFFFRNEPSLVAARVWPLHAEEHGVTAGDFWVSRYLFPSKRFVKTDEYEYRLDPFLFRMASGEDRFSAGGLFELVAYDRKGTESSYRAIPLVFGYSRDGRSAVGAIPFYYGKDFGPTEIDYGTPWRFLFLTHHLRGVSGEEHTGVLWKLFERTTNPNRPEFQELGLAYRFYFLRSSETSRQLQINPLYSYFRDETADESQHSFLFSLYNLRTVKGRREHTLFWVISF